MPILYVDNFRGFQAKFLPLKNINFFVGENSTGKTSILRLLGVISSPSFWRHNVFGENETYLGNFSEIISNSSEKEYFEVALLDRKKSEANKFCGYKFRFIEEVNFPAIKEIRYIDENLEFQATIDGDFLKYRFESNKTIKIINDNDTKFFTNWINSNRLIDKVLKRKPINSKSLMQIIFQLQSLINLDLYNPTINAFFTENLDIGLPSILNNMAWFAPTVAVPTKTYTRNPLVFDAMGNHIPSVLLEIILNEDVQKILKKFGQDSGLFEGLNVKELGDEKNDAFELQFSIGDSNNQMLNIMNVGYGISQVLPLIVEAIARPDNSWIACQQPETHLHPRAQAALGEFIFKSNKIDKQNFILETHSDYIIDRFRLRLNSSLKDNSSNKESISQVVFFSRNHLNANNFDIIQIEHDGSYSEEQPDSFRNFFFNEQLNLLRI